MLRAIACVLVSMLVGACAGSVPTTSPSVEPVRPAESTQPPPAATIAPQPSPAIEPSPSGEVWDLLWVSNSTASRGLAEAYAKRIEAAEGVTVRVRNGWTPGIQASTVLNTLTGASNGGVLASAGAGEFNLQDAVREAEVIVIFGSPDASADLGDAACGSDTCGPVPSCIPGGFDQFEADLGAIFDEVFKLREGRPVILRTHDMYLPWGPHAAWQACNIVEPCVECNQRQLSAAVHRAAAAHGVPVASWMKALNGPNQDEPLPSPWMSDGLHPSAEGSEHLADVVAALGFEPVAPPK